MKDTTQLDKDIQSVNLEKLVAKNSVWLQCKVSVSFVTSAPHAADIEPLLH